MMPNDMDIEQLLLWMNDNRTPAWEAFSIKLDHAIADLYCSQACDGLREVLSRHHATGNERRIIMYKLLGSKALMLHPDLMEEFTHILLADIREETLSMKEA